MIEFIRKLACRICQSGQKPKLELVESIRTAAQVNELLDGIPTLQQRFIWDSQFWHVSHEAWGEIFADVLLNLPTYISEKFDCENIALVVLGRIQEHYQLNSVGVAVGQSPFGYHAFNIFGDELGLHYLEPQNGLVYEIGNLEGYRAEIVILG